MSSVVVSGFVLPVALGGHPALDFCNTRADWGSAVPKEYLLSYDHVAVWVGTAGLLGARGVDACRRAARADPDAAQAVLAEALQLREAAYAVLLGARSSEQFAVVATHTRVARGAASLRRSPPGTVPAARWTLPSGDVEAPLLVAAAALDELLCSGLSAAVAACPGWGCGWLFADPRRRRRWCDMAVCGNRAKARRHAQRRAGGGGR